MSPHSDRSPLQLEVGFGIPPGFWRLTIEERTVLLDAVRTEGFDHVVVSDHVAFRGGGGRDGLTQAAMLSMLTDLPIHIGVLLVGLRHPTLIARQAVDIVEQSSCDLVIGVGVGGEDPEEFTMCGIEVHDRGARIDEALPVLRQLLDGGSVQHRGEHFSVAGAGLRRETDSRIGITIGGGVDAALTRAADHDGWLGAFCDERTWRSRALQVAENSKTSSSLGLQIWAGVDPDAGVARRLVEAELERFYGIPGRAFEQFTPAGGADVIVEFGSGYVDAGMNRINVFAVGREPLEVVRVLGDASRQLKEMSRR